MKRPFTLLAIMPWYPANKPRYLVDAFEQVGCRVFRVGPTYFNHGGIEWDDLPDVHIKTPREYPAWDLDYWIDRCTRDYATPDMVIVSEENYTNTIIPTRKIPSVLLSEDGWPDSYERVEMVKPTVAFTNHPLGIRAHPHTTIDPRWRYLPGACAPWIHQNYHKPRSFDFVLYATMYGARLELCRYLEENGYKVSYGQCDTAHYVDWYNRGIATYCNVNRNGHEVKWRFFEAAAMGCVNIIDHSDLLKMLGYKSWKHYIPISLSDENLDDPWPDREILQETVKQLCLHPTLAANIAYDAEKHTLAHHTYFHRVVEIMQAIGIGQLDEALADKVNLDTFVSVEEMFGGYS